MVLTRERRIIWQFSALFELIYLAIDDDWCVDVSSAEGIADGIKIGL